jgi:hypothetical protein
LNPIYTNHTKEKQSKLGHKKGTKSITVFIWALREQQNEFGGLLHHTHKDHSELKSNSRQEE